MASPVTYDYIIIGAGSAGCVLANRLSANPNHKVCLIEAGGSDKSPAVKIPAGLALLYNNKKYDYAYISAPQKNLNNRRIAVNRGKGFGGSSSINGMVYIRGNRQDYDTWRDLGCKGWGYEDVLPVFKRIEKNRLNQSSEYHGASGELIVDNPRDPHPLCQTFINAAKDASISHNTDFNAEKQDGVGVYNVTQDNGQRFSSFSAFVRPILDRSNLTILANTTVQKLDIDGNTVKGVHILSEGKDGYLTCAKEVILSAGAIASPQVLLASGIGDKDELSELKIPLQKHVPGVGKNLQDHIDSMVTVRMGKGNSIGVSWKTLPQVLSAPFRYLLGRKGYWTTNYVEAGGFARTKYANDIPDVQFHFTPIYRSHRGRAFEWGYGFSFFCCVLRPKSTGSVSLEKNGSGYNVMIDHNFLSDPEDAKVLIEAVRTSRKILASPHFQALDPTEIRPGPDVQTDEEILEYLRDYASTVYHPASTCKMGIDEMAVVSPEDLKVTGMDNLRIADASIMPNVVSGNTNAPSIMIGEKASEMILKS